MGSTFGAGLQWGTQQAALDQQHKQMLSDEEHAQKINDQIALRSANMEKLRNLPKVLPDGKPNPEYDAAHRGIFDAETSLRTLYHPENHPNAIAKFGHLLTDHLKITSPEQRAGAEQRKNVQNLAGDERATQQFASALPPSDEQAAVMGAQAQGAGQRAQIDQAVQSWKSLNKDATPEEEQKFRQELTESAILGYKRTPTSDRGSWELVQGTKNGQPFSYYHDKYTNRNASMEGGDLEAGDLDGFVPAAKGAGKPSTSQFNETLAAYAKSHNTTVDKLPFEAYQFVTRAMAMARGIPSSATNTTLKQDVNGMWVPVTETNSRTPGAGVKLNDPLGPANSNWMAPASGQAPPDPRSGTAAPEQISSTAPPSPAELRREAEKRKPAASPGTTSGRTHVGPPLFQGRTPEITKAHNDVIAATKIEKMGEDMVQNPSSEKDALFVLSLIRSEAGRVNQQEIAQLFQAGGIEEAPERWAAKFGHGELSPELRQQLLGFTQAQVGAAQDAYNSLLAPSAQGRGSSGSGGFDWNSAPEHH